MVYASHKPATYDVTGISEQQFRALRDGLLMMIEANRMDDKELSSARAEQLRLVHVAAIELLDATSDALREEEGQRLMSTDYTRYEPGNDGVGRLAIFCTDCGGNDTDVPVWTEDDEAEQVTPLSLANWIAHADEHEAQRHGSVAAYTPTGPASDAARAMVHRLFGPAVLGGNLPAAFEEADRILAELGQSFADELGAVVGQVRGERAAAYVALRSFADAMAKLATAQLKIEPRNQAWKAVDDCAREVLAGGILRSALEAPQNGGRDAK